MTKHGRRVLLQRIFIAVSLLVLVIIISCSTYNFGSSISQNITLVSKNESEDNRSVSTGRRQSLRSYNATGQHRKILLWTSLFSGWDFMVARPGAFDGCPEKRCQVTTDRSAIKESDAVVFHIRTFALYDMPPFRDITQKWIFFSMEAPPHSSFPGYPFMYNMYNWTMSYREDSDIVISYGRILRSGKKRFTRTAEDLNAIWRDKTKVAVWMASHCLTSGRREEYVKELQNHMDVDVLGGCGMAVCPQNETSACLRTFAKTYKFFLAFENAICNDYVTEKFFRILMYDIVPVVFGGARYLTIAPNNSFINALDYTPVTLARFLNQLSKNSSQYFEYLKWKEHGYDVVDRMNRCKLCTKLHSKDFLSKSVYADIGRWWIGKSTCREWRNG